MNKRRLLRNLVPLGLEDVEEADSQIERECHNCRNQVMQEDGLECKGRTCRIFFCKVCLINHYDYVQRDISIRWKCPVCTNKCLCFRCSAMNNNNLSGRRKTGKLLRKKSKRKKKLKFSVQESEEVQLTNKEMEVKEEREDDSNPENEQSSLPMEQELTPCHCRKLHQTQNLIPCTNPNCSVLFCIQCIQKYDPLYTSEEDIEEMKREWSCLLCREICECDDCRKRLSNPNINQILNDLNKSKVKKENVYDYLCKNEVTEEEKHKVFIDNYVIFEEDDSSIEDSSSPLDCDSFMNDKDDIQEEKFEPVQEEKIKCESSELLEEESKDDVNILIESPSQQNSGFEQQELSKSLDPIEEIYLSSLDNIENKKLEKRKANDLIISIYNPTQYKKKCFDKVFQIHKLSKKEAEQDIEKYYKRTLNEHFKCGDDEVKLPVAPAMPLKQMHYENYTNLPPHMYGFLNKPDPLFMSPPFTNIHPLQYYPFRSYHPPTLNHEIPPNSQLKPKKQRSDPELQDLELCDKAISDSIQSNLHSIHNILHKPYEIQPNPSFLLNYPVDSSKNPTSDSKNNDQNHEDQNNPNQNHNSNGEHSHPLSLSRSGSLSNEIQLNSRKVQSKSLPSSAQKILKNKTRTDGDSDVKIMTDEECNNELEEKEGEKETDDLKVRIEGIDVVEKKKKDEREEKAGVAERENVSTPKKGIVSPQMADTQTLHHGLGMNSYMDAGYGGMMNPYYLNNGLGQVVAMGGMHPQLYQSPLPYNLNMNMNFSFPGFSPEIQKMYACNPRAMDAYMPIPHLLFPHQPNPLFPDPSTHQMPQTPPSRSLSHTNLTNHNQVPQIHKTNHNINFLSLPTQNTQFNHIQNNPNTNQYSPNNLNHHSLPHPTSPPPTTTAGDEGERKTNSAKKEDVFHISKQNIIPIDDEEK